jgi:hypothetical protein
VGAHSTPTFWTVSARAPWLLADRLLITAHCQDGVFSRATLVDLVADRLDLVPGHVVCDIGPGSGSKLRTSSSVNDCFSPVPQRLVQRLKLNLRGWLLV